MTQNSGRGNLSETWRLGFIPGPYALLVIACVLGLAAGTGAFVIKWMIRFTTIWVTREAEPAGWNGIFFVLPIIGILLAVAFQQFVAKRNLEHGTDRIDDNLRRGDYYMAPSMIIFPMIASTFTLGFGGSAGAEGPIATSGAAMGSNIARKLGMPPGLMRILIGCGACAGIAGIFKAPVGGVMFTLEVLKLELTTMSVLACVVAAVVASMTAYGLSGFTLDVPLTHPQYFDPSMSGWVIILGVFCGLYSLYYTGVGEWLRRMFERIPSVWVRALVSGAILGGCILLFPALYGEGYGVMAKLIDGDFDAVLHGSVFNSGGVTGIWTIVAVCGGIAALKTVACYSTNSGGGVAGDFAPTLVAGCMAGFFFAGVMNHIFGVWMPMENFALIGMAGCMAGIIRAPLMSVFIVVEATGYYGMLFPVAIAAAVSYATSTVAGHFIRREDRWWREIDRHNQE